MNTSGSSRITVIGSINTDMVVKTPTLPEPGQTVIGDDFFMAAGGKGGNQAVAAARQGGNVAMVANIGNDLFGDSGLQRLTDEGVDCSGVTRDPDKSSGVALISVDDAGENHIVVAPGANNTLSVDHVRVAFDSIPADSIVLLQLEVPLAAVVHAVQLAAARNCRVILDPAPARELPEEVLRNSYLLTPNASEARILTGIAVKDTQSAAAAAARLRELGAGNVAITLGEGGVLLADAEGTVHVAATPVRALDSTAAGDCFNGSLAVALAAGHDLQTSIAYACRAAAIAVTRLGAQDAMPHGHELEPPAN